MAKKSSTVSPQKPVEAGLSEGESVEVDEGEVNSDADGHETFYDARDATSLSPTREHQNTQHQATVANVGNANSTEKMSRKELSAAIHAEAEKVRKKHGGTQQPSRTSTGKLRPVSAGTRNNNPHYRNPIPSAASAQRQLPPVQMIRKSVYDVDADPPVRLGATKSKGLDSGISPRKADKRKARRGDKNAVETADMSLQNVFPEGSTRSSKLMKSTVEADGEGAAEQAQMDDYLAHVYGQEEEADAGADEDEEDGEDGDDIRVADREVDAMEEDGAEPRSTTTGEPTQRPKRGRPRKTTTDVREESPKQAKKDGRPSKSDKSAPEPEEPTEPTNDQSRPKRSTRSVNAQERSATGHSSAAARVQTRSTQSRPEQSAKGSALAGLRKRKSQADRENQPENDNPEADRDAEGDQDGEEADGLFVPPSAQRPQAGQQPDYVRLSEMDFSGSEDEEELRPVQPAQSSGSKRKASSQAASPNTSKKRARIDGTTQEDETEQADEGERASTRRLFGQWPAFKDLLRKSDEIGRTVRDNVPAGVRNYVELRDADVDAIVQLCKQATRQYNALRTQSGPVESDQDPVDLLGEIGERVDGLCFNNRDYPTNRNDKTKATDIYYHAVRELIDLIRTSILCYEALDADGEGGAQMTTGHLKIIIQLMKLLLDLMNSARKYARPPTHLHVVQPVREMIPLLQNIYDALNARMQHYELSQRTQRRQEQERRDRAAQAEEDARRRQQEALAKRFREKWQKLHTERMLIEGGLMRASKRAHLAIPDEYHTEYDHNGIPFEREELFHPRLGPPPDLVEAAMKQPWSLVELSALADGLKVYTGEHVFERTFRRYCGPGRELNKYNVTEVVAMAVQVKERLIEDQRRKYGDVEKWVLDIPVWTRGPHREGQENVDEVEVIDEGDLTMSGGKGEA